MRNDIDALIQDLLKTKEELDALKKQQAGIEKELSELLAMDIEDQLKHSDYGTGTVTVKTDGYTIKATVPKKVKWDQEKLLALHDRIIAHGDDPRAYMKAEFKVSEASFKNWPENIQNAFIDCREIGQGKVTFKFDGR